MRHLTLVSATLTLCFAAVGCSSMGFGYDPDALRKQVAFESKCPEEKIQINEALEAGTGHTKFRLDVCGKEQRWNRYGTSYFPEGKSPGGM
jgi:hypothetical protein